MLQCETSWLYMARLTDVPKCKRVRVNDLAHELEECDAGLSGPHMRFGSSARYVEVTGKLLIELVDCFLR